VEKRTGPAPGPLVSAAACPDYRAPGLALAVAEVLERLEPLDLRPGDLVLLKPNCLSAHDGPERPTNTRAEVVEAVGGYLRDRHRVRLLIADSGGLGSYGRSQRSYRLMGLHRTAERLGAELVNLEAQGLIRVASPRGAVLPDFEATALLTRVQAVVNLPKLKTHLLTGMTGAVKNCLGLLPGSLKRAVHAAAPSREAMSSALVDIYAGLTGGFNFCLHLLDGVVAMEGAGPSQGRPRRVGWLLGSRDGVALDGIASMMMGFSPLDIRTTFLAQEAGLGVGEPKRIRLTGAAPGDLVQAGFERPSSGLILLLGRLLPAGATGRIMNLAYEAKPRPVKGRCTGCGLCVQACPVQAVTLSSEGPQVSRERCIECYCCLEHCPSGGLRIPASLRERVKRMAGRRPGPDVS